MPIYEYKCSKCGHVFEAFQRLGADGSELSCPQCGTARPDKLFSTIACAAKSGSASAGSHSGGGSHGFS